jgi:hypothetical protein
MWLGQSYILDGQALVDFKCLPVSRTQPLEVKLLYVI